MRVWETLRATYFLVVLLLFVVVILDGHEIVLQLLGMVRLRPGRQQRTQRHVECRMSNDERSIDGLSEEHLRANIRIVVRNEDKMSDNLKQANDDESVIQNETRTSHSRKISLVWWTTNGRG